MVRDRDRQHNIRVALDETTDSSIRSIGAFLLSSMDQPQYGPYVLNIAEMSGAKHNGVMDFFEESLEILYNEGN